jgi:ABC-type cobalamin/Fe3+-siderophores transport system ATPase subunit
VLLDRGRIVADGGASEVLSAASIAEYYGAHVHIVEEDGAVFVLPRRERRG